MWLQAFIIIFISIQKAFHFNYKQKCNATMQKYSTYYCCYYYFGINGGIGGMDG